VISLLSAAKEVEDQLRLVHAVVDVTEGIGDIPHLLALFKN
jgi:hypothetical protein